MKKSILIVFFLYFQLIAGDEAEKTTVFTECATELSISTEIPQHFREHGELPESADDKTKCLFHCAAKKLGVNTESDTVNKEKMIEWISTIHPNVDREKLSSIVNSCSERSESDACERWYEFSKCTMNELKA